jgi:hypothetical protein
MDADGERIEQKDAKGAKRDGETVDFKGKTSGEGARRVAGRLFNHGFHGFFWMGRDGEGEGILRQAQDLRRD